MRQELGFASEDAPSVREMFQQGYRGSRYSFGYPACPNLEDRALIAELLRPEDIRVSLSENFMLVPNRAPTRWSCTIRRRNTSTCDFAHAARGGSCFPQLTHDVR
jgi:cobalamin-dependent methionine synthase I